MSEKPTNFQVVAENRNASREYHFLEKWEAGIVLWGTEVKSIREGRVNIRDSFVRVVKGEVFILNLHITPYSKTSSRDLSLTSTRERKLLLKQSEIRALHEGLIQKGLTCVPTKLYFKRGLAKVEIALSKGKQLYDKRRDLKDRLHQREMDRARKSRS